LIFDISGINESKLISKPIQAPNHEFADTEMRTPPNKVIIRRIFVELFGIREEE